MSPFQGYFFDDHWDNFRSCSRDYSVGPTEIDRHAVQDMGLDADEVKTIRAAFAWTMDKVYEKLRAKKLWAWQMFWNANQTKDGGVALTSPQPLVTKTTCATALRRFCGASSETQRVAMIYGLSGSTPTLANTDFVQDLVSFMLIRGRYAWLGTGWKGADRQYSRPPQLNADYGTPQGFCAETAPAIFTRNFTRAVVSMDCASWNASIFVPNSSTRLRSDDTDSQFAQIAADIVDSACVVVNGSAKAVYKYDLRQLGADQVAAASLHTNGCAIGIAPAVLRLEQIFSSPRRRVSDFHAPAVFNWEVNGSAAVDATAQLTAAISANSFALRYVSADGRACECPAPVVQLTVPRGQRA